MKLILASAAVTLFVGFIILLIFALNTRPALVTVPDDYKFRNNVSIGGVDIGGKTKNEVAAALKDKVNGLLGSIQITVNVKGQDFKYKAGDIGIETNLDTAMKEALLFSQMGAGYKDVYGIMVKKDGGADIKLLPVLNVKKTKVKLAADTEKLNIEPQDAKVVFDAKNTSDPISYESEKKGAVVDMDGLIGLIAKAVKTQDFSKINAPIKEVAPRYTLNEIKQKTTKISSYTSSFAGDGLHSKNRVFNIKKMTKIINGQVIDPGEKWSMNEVAGDRTEENGWALAPGIENGVYTDQAGGGVCQVSSTLYNAALCAEIEIVDRKPHTWPSVYIPKGLDATISTGGPDLVLRNNNTMPVYIVAYVDDDKMTCTVTIYGEPLKHGYKIRMVSKVVSYELPPKPEVEYRDTDANGDPLPPGKSILAREGKPEIKAYIYKQYLDKDGKVIQTRFLYETKYRAKAKLYYENPDAPKASDSQSPKASSSPKT